MPLGKAIRSLQELAQARLAKKSVACLGFNGPDKPCPAVFVMNMPGDVILRMINSGLYIYIKPTKSK